MKRLGTPIAFTMALVASTPAFAHVGAGVTGGFTHGLTHPIFGLDHLLAMITVGLWAGFTGGTAKWLWPTAFVSAMILGALAGMGGLALLFVEPVILASVILLGAFLALALRLPVAVGAALVAVFGLFHGYAHGTEAPVDASGVAYIGGFALATAGLHGIGLGLSALSERVRGAPVAGLRAVGGLVGVLGVWMAVS